MKEVLQSHWFTNRDGTTGIVRVRDEYLNINYYIGHVDAYDQKLDEQYLADWGSTFPNEAGDKLFGIL
jgi:hypothetical protein